MAAALSSALLETIRLLCLVPNALEAARSLGGFGIDAFRRRRDGSMHPLQSSTMPVPNASKPHGLSAASVSMLFGEDEMVPCIRYKAESPT
jgi:hypothetical protein